ncbi:DUF3072 domain-containing protein [Azospirillum thermophilum]|uniref:DUF3072 domain-containing protein n=1 Tax=Azospirillum thermophilum TaxID=2202148 RepID=A0A2S2CMD2_9PROT|nr:DUF3072 domain-containing protein [Azospirillum thermophilum]AWK85467.1 DUF3072 domain-containing protein [Azospirillum thermophilum]
MNEKRDGHRDDRPHSGQGHDSPKTGEGFSNRDKDPDDWTTGDEPMTGAQASYLKTLSEEAGETFDDSLTKAEASKRIDALQEKTGRGQ